MFVSGIVCGGVAMLKISAIYFKATVCLLPRAVSGLVVVGFRSTCVRSSDTCISESFYDIIGKGVIACNFWNMNFP